MLDSPLHQEPPLASARELRWWMLAFGVALVVDGPIAHLFQPIAATVKHSEWAEGLKLIGHFGLVMFLAVLVGVLHPSGLRGSLLLCSGGILSGLFYSVSKWVVGRTRPVVAIRPYELDPFVQGLHGILHGRNLSFPSGHTALAFATAACLAYLLPRQRRVVYLIAGVVAVERVVELAHYLSDTVAGAGIGILSFRLALCAAEWTDGRRRVEPAPAAV